MNLAKKFLLPLIAALCVSAAFAAGKSRAPTFDNPNAYVFNVAEIKGKAKDNIRLVSEIFDEVASFKVYVYNEKLDEWLVWGVGTLKGYDDADFVDTKSKKLKNYQWFAVESVNNREYSYAVSKRHDDLYITVSPSK